MSSVDTSTKIAIPRILISGLSGGSGKTLLSLGISHAWSNANIDVFPYKKGPDYIDATWLGLSTKHPCYCLDPFFMDDVSLRNHFIDTFMHSQHKHHAKNSLAIIEGNRGIFDGKDVDGSCSSAKVANNLQCPVILTINCTKMTRTVAALVMGINHFDPTLALKGVILNNTGTDRHAKLVRDCVEQYTDIPVLGTLPRLAKNPIPERHMGLHLHQSESQETILNDIAEYVQEHVDISTLHEIAKNAPPFIVDTPQQTNILPENIATPPIIAYIRDDALWFYYQENLDDLEKLGAKLIPLSILDETPWQEQIKKYSDIPINSPFGFDALYIGGGFPELYAQEIANSPHLTTLRTLANANMPIYAECGGFIVLSNMMHLLEKEEHNSKSYAMTNIFPTDTKIFKKPQGLGYVTAHTERENPYHPLHSVWHGHEFHFSKLIQTDRKLDYILQLKPGHGMEKTKDFGHDGLCYKQCYASYTHLFSPTVPHWSINFIKAANIFKTTQQKNTG